MTDVTAPLPGVETHPGSGHYAVYDHGAHVWAWQPEGQRPVLWLSSATGASKHWAEVPGRRRSHSSMPRARHCRRSPTR